jgi:hypothetical protein
MGTGYSAFRKDFSFLYYIIIRITALPFPTILCALLKMGKRKIRKTGKIILSMKANYINLVTYAKRHFFMS